jgi:hypothetical protein
MPDIAERVAEKVRQLPQSYQREVLHYVEFLELKYDDSDISDGEWLKILSKNPAFASLHDPEEDIYTIEDGKPYIPSS